MKVAGQSKQGISYDEVALVAYQLWEAEGRPEGRSVEHWLAAESRLGAVVPVCKSSKESSVVEPSESPIQAAIRYGLVLKPRKAT